MVKNAVLFYLLLTVNLTLIACSETNRMRTTGRLSRMSGLLHARFAFRRALAARVCSRLTRQHRKLALEAGRLKYIPGVLSLSVTIVANTMIGSIVVKLVEHTIVVFTTL